MCMKDGRKKRKRTEGILFRFVQIFGVFSIVTLFTSGITIYFLQMKAYKAQCVESVQRIGEYLEQLIQDSGNEFIEYQNYYMNNYQQIDIPYDFSEYKTAYEEYLKIVNETNPPGYMGVEFNSYSEDARNAFFIYLHEYWVLTFEKVRATFNLPYTYYLVPREEIYHMVYMIDGERTHKGLDGEKADEGKYLYLGDEYFDSPEKYTVQWKTWFTGEKQDDFEVWNNEWGHTYAYYTPLIINGKKLGLIGTEIDVETVNKTILTTALNISAAIALAFIICMIIVLFFINSRYINRIVCLESQMREFAREKNPEMIRVIRKTVKGRDEIDFLSIEFADMIMELEVYMNNLLSTRKELKDTKMLADEMNALANKDALTGVRNKTAYDNEVRRLEWHIADGRKDFCIAMIDLNFLKVINDNFGHERGDAAIKKLCSVICNVFKNSHVFRIGGDEFVVIMENDDYKQGEGLVQVFNTEITGLYSDNTLDPWEKVSAAIGYAFFEDSDESVSDVFRRADKNMYEHKKAMKAIRNS